LRFEVNDKREFECSICFLIYIYIEIFDLIVDGTKDGHHQLDLTLTNRQEQKIERNVNNLQETK